MQKQISIDHIQAKNAVVKDRTILMKNARRLGVYVAYIGLRLGLRPIHLTYFTFMLGLAVCMLFALGKDQSRVVALILLILWQIFDTADGSMARALGKKSNYGGFVDYVGGMFLVAFLHPCIALGLTLHPERWSTVLISFGRHPEILIFVAGISGASGMLFRLILKVAEIRFQQRIGDDQSLAESSSPSLILLLKELENFGGFQIPLLAISVILGSLTIFILVYFVLESILLIGVSLRLFWGFRNFHQYPAS